VAQVLYLGDFPTYCLTLSVFDGRTEMLPKNWTVTFTLPVRPTLDHFLGNVIVRVPSLGRSTEV
jgi:hypothetical protein